MPIGFTTVTASFLQDATGTLIDNATLYARPVSSVTGASISFRAGGDEGATMFTPVSALVTLGSVQITLADTSLTWPANIGYALMVIDNVTGNSLLGPGYGCIQPTGSTWSLDAYEPNLGTLVSVQTGPQGQPGIPGGVAGTMFDAAPTGTIDGNNVTFTLAGSPSILFLTKNGQRQSSPTDYTLSGSTVTFTPAAVPAPGDTLWATGISPAPVNNVVAGGGVQSEILLSDTDGNAYAYGSRSGQLAPLGAVPVTSSNAASVLSSLQLADSDGNTYTYVSRYGQLARQ